jgi:hypothetical protein
MPRARALRRLAHISGLALLLGLGPVCRAESVRFCDHASLLSAQQKDLLFRFSAIVKDELDASGQRVALVARSGMNLDRLGLRYSHSGVSLQASDNNPWSVRQLYYACDEGQPKLFDQGMSGFLLGTDSPDIGYVSLVFLPAERAAPLETAALDKARALQVLNPVYSANAYAYDTRYQNCNQWVMELLASAWGATSVDPAPGTPSGRVSAQRWLQQRGYEPTVIDVGGPLMWVGLFSPYVHYTDHPRADVEAGLNRVSMPEAMDRFVRRTVPGARRVEICHSGRRVVVHEGWDAVAEGCVAAPQDRVVMLD